MRVVPVAVVSIKDLISLCSEAPFGRDDATVVDKMVRSCWQLDPDKFTIVNSDTWPDAFVDLKHAVCLQCSSSWAQLKECRATAIQVLGL